MNITIDDTSPNFVWSSSGTDAGWRKQDETQDQLNAQYFLETFHATQTKASNVSVTFVGSAIYIYGTTGPNHGNYSVTFDNAIKFSPGFSVQTEYRQLLFSHSFGATFETHTVVLRNEENFWLDIDYAVLTISTTAETATSDIGFFTNTVSPATAVPSQGLPGSLNTSLSSASSTDTVPSIFRILTFALGGALGLALLVGLVWFFLTRRRTARGNQSGRPKSRYDDVSGQGEFKYAQQNRPISSGVNGGGGGGGGTSVANTSLLGFRSQGGRNGAEDHSLLQSPASLDESRYSRMDPLTAASSPGNGSTGGVSGAARETLIALNNMGKRPGYRNLAGDQQGGSGRETPTSMRTMGSAGQVWLGATKSEDGLQGQPNPNSNNNARFKGRAARGAGQRNSSYGSSTANSSGIGLDIYASKLRSDSDVGGRDDKYDKYDLKRSASVASSGILDRMTSSPPPAVPELPPSATASFNSSTRTPQMPSTATTQSVYSPSPLQAPPRSFSPTPTESTTLHSNHQHQASLGGGVTAWSGLGLATKIQHPYGRNNEMLVHSHSGSIQSTATGGSLPLRPPPVATRTNVAPAPATSTAAAADERARQEKERERERERVANANAARYSRPPPEYVAAAVAAANPGQHHQPQATLQRNGTRTGDIPIGIESGAGGGGGGGYDSESQDSHSIAHAYVGTAMQVQVSPPQQQQQRQQQQPPPPPRIHARKDGQMGSNGSSSLGLPNHGATSRAGRPITPERTYQPDRTMAMRAGSAERSYTPDRAPAWVGRSSEDRTWGLDGVKTGTGAGNPNSSLGRPIMDDRTRLNATPVGGPRRVSRVPAPSE